LRATFEASELRPAPAGSVVSIGVFDGVHLGHQEILRRNVARAREEGLEPTVLTFRRPPKRVLLGRAPQAITSLEHRFELFRRLGIEHVVALRFTDELRQVAPEEFVRRYLLEGLDARRFVLGFDSKFGRDRAGTPELLHELGHPVEVVPQVVVAKRPVSSTAIREAVALGDLEGAAAMLGRPVTILGKVVHGDAIGRTLGFPTANLDLMHGLHPPPGVWACRARVLADKEPEVELSDRPARPAVTNIGRRPTVAGDGGEPRVEVHLLDWRGDLYGSRLEVEFVARLREERRFESVEALREQIDRDVAAARGRLGAG
jgi:riboflavin kinase/FMN adenylyltransferase